MNALQKLLNPFDVRCFCREYMQRRAIYIQGTAEKFEGLFHSSDLYRYLRGGHAHCAKPAVIRAGYKDHAGEHREVTVSPHQVEPLLDAGMTVMIARLEAVDARLAALARRLASELSIAEPIDIAAFMSKDRSGYGLHFDPSSMWIIQLEGTKRWQFGRAPAVAYPMSAEVPVRAERAGGVHGFDESTLSEQLLGPGDVLYLPAGTWHRVQAVGYSLHLSIAVVHVDVLSWLFETFSRNLSGKSASRNLSSPHLANQSSETVRARVEQALAEQLDDVRSALRTMTSSDLYTAWRDRVDPPRNLDEPAALERKAGPFTEDTDHGLRH